VVGNKIFSIKRGEEIRDSATHAAGEAGKT
jgi:hypothetical protein